MADLRAPGKRNVHGYGHIQEFATTACEYPVGIHGDLLRYVRQNRGFERV